MKKIKLTEKEAEALYEWLTELDVTTTLLRDTPAEDIFLKEVIVKLMDTLEDD